jgi:hypothetical protein
MTEDKSQAAEKTTTDAEVREEPMSYDIATLLEEGRQRVYTAEGRLLIQKANADPTHGGN